MFWEKKKGGEHLHPEGLGFAKLFEVIRDVVVAADAKAQRIVRWSWLAIGIFGHSPSEALNGTCVERLWRPSASRPSIRRGWPVTTIRAGPLYRGKQAS